jgi:hypothetical protein
MIAIKKCHLYLFSQYSHYQTIILAIFSWQSPIRSVSSQRQQASFFVRGACFVFTLILLLLLVIYVFAQRPRRDCGTTFRQHFEVQELKVFFQGL